MARTSRSGAPSVDALDNLNLDDMFADGGDDLFDGLDIDLGNMDDITAGNVEEKKNNTATRPAAPVAPPAAAPAATEEFPRRRKTRRKTKSPVFFDYDDDDYVEEKAKKKRKTSKAASKNKKASKKAAPMDDTSRTSQSSKSKGKVKAAGAMPPPLARGSSSASSTVAAAGRFGGQQQKRSGSFTLPKGSKAKTPPRVVDATSRAKGSLPASASGPASLPVKPSTYTPPPSKMATHPGLAQGPFCGLIPSDTLFYPFMPALPSEPSLKSRKVYALVDRVLSSFMSHLQTPKTTEDVTPAADTEPIYKLMQDSFKDEKSAANAPHKNETIGNAIGALRRTISFFDKERLAADLLAVCALLKRQHDFLKQNTANMERWCRGNFSEPDYAAVYLPESQQWKQRSLDLSAPASVLATFETSNLKVKVVCTGFKEPRAGPLLATLSPVFARPLEETELKKTTTKKAKKRKVSAVGDTKLSPSRTETAASVPVSYPQMKPNKRRKAVTDMIAKAARELESKYLQRIENYQQMINTQQGQLRKLLNEDDATMIHTSGMWRWVEQSGHFNRFTRDDVQMRLDGLVSPDMSVLRTKELSGKPEHLAGGTMRGSSGSSLFDRLQSLLVDEGSSDYDAEEDEDDMDDDIEDSSSSVADLTNLTLDERAFLQLRSIGLVERMAPSKVKSSDANLKKGLVPVSVESQPEGSSVVEVPVSSFGGTDITTETDDELKGAIKAMEADLCSLNGLNNKRIAFLESASRSHLVSAEDSKRKSEAEMSLISKCQLLLKKTKELKAKSGKNKSVANKDGLALPW